MFAIDQPTQSVDHTLLARVAETFYDLLPQYQGIFAPKDAKLFDQEPPGISFIAEYMDPDKQRLIDAARVGVFVYGTPAVDDEGNPGTQIETSVVADVMQDNPAKLNLKRIRLIDREFEEYVLFVPEHVEDPTELLQQFAAEHLSALFEYLEESL